MKNYPDAESRDILGCTDRRRPLHDGKGFVELVDMMPRIVPIGRTGDYAVAQAARVSHANDRIRTLQEDATLIRYLMRHRHTSPFEMVEFKFNVSLPIFVARQWIRHRTASVNEVSARYTELPDNYYIPGEWRRQGTSNKQGGEEPMEYDPCFYESSDLSLGASGEGSAEDMALLEYHRRLKAGVSRELARTCLPVSTYTRWYWKCDLHNIMHFLALRLDPHAQLEIRDYANAVLSLVEPLVPETIAAFRDYRLESVTLSRLEIESLRAEILKLRMDLQHSKNTVSPVHVSQPVISNTRENEEWQTKRAKLGLASCDFSQGECAAT